jgi:hypothetical protein
VSLIDPGSATNFFSLLSGLRFDPATDRYSTLNALWLAELSRLVYRRSGEVASHRGRTRDDFLKLVGLSEARFFTDGHSQALLVQGSTFHVLVFRGTEPLRLHEDFLTDVRLHFRDWPGGSRVHAGFGDAFDGIWKQIKPALQSVRTPLFCTGHSLGGALATLAASAAPSDGISFVATYTFGSPRVGDTAFAGSIAGLPLYRVVNDVDLVPHLPFFSFGYRHSPRLAKITHAGDLEFREDTVDSGDPSFSILPEKILDHVPMNYVSLLRDILRRQVTGPV